MSFMPVGYAVLLKYCSWVFLVISLYLKHKTFTCEWTEQKSREAMVDRLS